MENHQELLEKAVEIAKREGAKDIIAKNEEEAMSLAEFFIAGEKDTSTEKEREQHSFRINEIEMVTNDAFEAKEHSEYE